MVREEILPIRIFAKATPFLPVDLEKTAKARAWSYADAFRSGGLQKSFPERLRLVSRKRGAPRPFTAEGGVILLRLTLESIRTVFLERKTGGTAQELDQAMGI